MRTLSSLALLVAGSATLLWAAERPCVMIGYGPPTSCQQTNHWSRSVDLNGDGHAEFLHERWRVEKRRDGFDYKGDPYWVIQDDDLEAFYPEPHVELYTQIFQPNEEPLSAYIEGMWLRAGEEILPEPPAVGRRESGWQWGIPWRNQRQLAAEGLGIILRYEDWWPCPNLPYEGCTFYRRAGWLVDTNRAGDLVQEHLFGFRVLEPDGYHLGWLRLRGIQGWPESRAELVDYAVHPDPARPLRAGEAARPALSAQRTRDHITVMWRAAWTGWRLERRRPPGQGAWETVPNVTGNTHSFPVADGPWLFRLVK